MKPWRFSVRYLTWRSTSNFKVMDGIFFVQIFCRSKSNQFIEEDFIHSYTIRLMNHKQNYLIITINIIFEISTVSLKLVYRYYKCPTCLEMMSILYKRLL